MSGTGKEQEWQEGALGIDNSGSGYRVQDTLLQVSMMIGFASLSGEGKKVPGRGMGGDFEWRRDRHSLKEYRTQMNSE